MEYVGIGMCVCIYISKFIPKLLLIIQLSKLLMIFLSALHYTNLNILYFPV